MKKTSTMPQQSKNLVWIVSCLLALTFFTILYIFNIRSPLGASVFQIAQTDSKTVLRIYLSEKKVEVDTGQQYSFTAYGEYSTTTIPVKVSWKIDDASLGKLSCGNEKSKTCAFKAGTKEGDANLTIERVEGETVLTDTAKITISEPVKNPFADEIPDWAGKAIVKFYKKGIIKGYATGKFGSGDPVTRSQVVTFVDRLLEAGDIDYSYDSKQKCDIFEDVAKDHFAYNTICRFHSAGFLDVTKGKFKPDEPAPRGLTSFFIYKVFGDAFKEGMKLDDSDFKANFPDVSRSHKYNDAIGAMNTLGIMTGYGDGSFGPENTLNRAEAAIILSRVDTLLEDLDVGTLVPGGVVVTQSEEGDELLSECDNDTHVRGYISNVLGENLARFETRKFNAEVLAEQLESGTIELSLMSTTGALVTRELQVSESNMRMEGVTQAGVKNTHGGNNYQSVELPPERTWTINCNEESEVCGAITILDDDNKQIEGSFMDKELGYTFFEPADNLILATGGSESQATTAESCHLFYNAQDHADVLAGVGEETDAGGEAERSPFGSSLGDLLDRVFQKAKAQDDDMIVAEIPIVLDSDAQFYSANTRTIWSRQRSIHAGLNVIYGLIEPLGNGNFAVTFPIAGQEAWLPGYGPTTTDKNDLTDEINDSDYYMINHPRHQDNEISFYYVGYDMATGIAGVAGDIGSFCIASKYDKNHAWGQQVADTSNGYAFSTLYGRTIVMGHEIGHLVNAKHEFGLRNACGQGLWTGSCGSTIMRSGAAGGAAPDNRMSFFSPTNSQRIADCLEDEL